jgi:hypothetical protein
MEEGWEKLKATKVRRIWRVVTGRRVEEGQPAWSISRENLRLEVGNGKIDIKCLNKYI